MKKRRIKKEVTEKISTLISAAFLLVAALAWNSAIQAIFKEYFEPKQEITALVTYAIVVTIIAIITTISIGKAIEKLK